MLTEHAKLIIHLVVLKKIIKNQLLKRNSFPQYFLDKIIKTYYDKNPFMSSDASTQEPATTNVGNIRYFQLPYIGYYSKVTQKRLAILIKRYCVPCQIKLIFLPYKIKNLFSFKDSIPFVKYGVVYQFTCAACNSRYIGETMRHISTRMKEHISTDKNSHIFLKTLPFLT